MVIEPFVDIPLRKSRSSKDSLSILIIVTFSEFHKMSTCQSLLSFCCSLLLAQQTLNFHPNSSQMSVQSIHTSPCGLRFHASWIISHILPTFPTV